MDNDFEPHSLSEMLNLLTSNNNEYKISKNCKIISLNDGDNLCAALIYDDQEMVVYRQDRIVINFPYHKNKHHLKVLNKYVVKITSPQYSGFSISGKRLIYSHEQKHSLNTQNNTMNHHNKHHDVMIIDWLGNIQELY